MTPLEDLKQKAREWIELDPDPTTRATLAVVVEDGDESKLQDLVGSRISFGTAGLRGAIGPGTNRMNRLVVRQTAAGVARALISNVKDCGSRGVVVGHDARHRSAAFASDVVEVLRAYSIDVHVFHGSIPTPLVAFAVTHLHAAGGIVITASHNPAADNGMKVYWEDGAQIVPPIDTQIAGHVAAVAAESVAARNDTSASPASIRDFAEPMGLHIEGSAPWPASGSVNHLGDPTSDDPLIHDYVKSVRALISKGPREPVRIAATSLHGVGALLLDRVLLDCGFDDLHLVESQRSPDPDFPTVAFPNPEEPGALDRLIELADDVAADVALANDPDADRLGAAFRQPSGTWRPLLGDELGALLADHLIRLTDGRPRRMIATTVVSSRLTSSMAASAGIEFHETLTGFKWLCRPGLTDPGLSQVLLYEEALGYAIGPECRDKDGISAALVLADLVADLKSRDATVWEVLDDLALKHGAHVQQNSSIRLDTPDWLSLVDAVMARLISNPPRSVAGIEVLQSELPAPDVLRLFLEDRTRVVVRPSGTEPKIKLYFEAIEDVRTSAEDARLAARRRLDSVEAAIRELLAI